MNFRKLAYFLLVGTVLTGVQERPGGSCATADQPQTGKRLEFRTGIVGEVVDAAATKAGFRTAGYSEVHLDMIVFNASDGEKLTTEYGDFSSPEEANRYFDWTVARAYKILAQGPKMDSEGRHVGQRAEVMFRPDRKQMVVIWTDGVRIHEIGANALADAQELERRYQHPVHHGVGSQ